MEDHTIFILWMFDRVSIEIAAPFRISMNSYKTKAVMKSTITLQAGSFLCFWVKSKLHLQVLQQLNFWHSAMNLCGWVLHICQANTAWKMLTYKQQTCTKISHKKPSLNILSKFTVVWVGEYDWSNYHTTHRHNPVLVQYSETCFTLSTNTQ